MKKGFEACCTILASVVRDCERLANKLKGKSLQRDIHYAGMRAMTRSFASNQRDANWFKTIQICDVQVVDGAFIVSLRGLISQTNVEEVI